MTLRLVKPEEERMANSLALEDGEYMEAVNHLYDWQHRGCDHFFCRLYELIMKGDESQRLRIALAYPFHSIAFERWKTAKTDRQFFRQNGFLID